MTQHSDSQYDDDLTVGMDEQESFSTDSVNLFEFTGDDESPIARLKTIILSIDWEINDDILHQLEEELLDLNDVWAGDKVKQVYIQGLDKIGKYIYKEKANAHPNAIKLLLTFYYNLEKIVSSEGNMSDDERKAILVADVKKFDQLKGQIGVSSPQPVAQKSVDAQSPVIEDGQDSDNPLNTLKARVLGIDWEISDHELEKLSEEVKRLEGVYSQSKAKLILLQGLGALGSYINTKRSQSNSTVFTLLHSFYDALEKITLPGNSAKEEKQILLAEVKKFNAFKTEIAKEEVESSAVISDAGSAIDQGEAVPAVAPAPPSKKAKVVETPGKSAKEDDSSEVATDVDSRLSSVFGDEIEEQTFSETSDESALAGVDVETEADDESDEEELPFEGSTVAPALMDAAEESSFSVESLADELAKSDGEEVEESDEEIEDILQGVDVETEADDDSDEESLPMEGGALAPALSGSDGDLGSDSEEETDSIGLGDRLDSFFGDEIESSTEDWGAEEEGDALFGGEEATGSDHEGVEEPVATDKTDVDEEVSVGLSFLDEEEPGPVVEAAEAAVVAESEVDEEVSVGLSFLDEEEPGPAVEAAETAPVDESEVEEEVSAGLSFLDEEEPGPAVEAAEESAPVAESEVEEEVSVGLSFLDEEEPGPAVEVAEESAPVAESEVEEEVSAGLSFLDEEEPGPAVEAAETSPVDETEVEEEVSVGLSFLDEEEPGPAVEAAEAAPVDESEVEEEVSAGLSFLDEETAGPSSSEEVAESLVGDEASVEEESTISDIAAERSTEVEIKFTVPGEDLPEGRVEPETEVKPSEDVIEFNVPGEGAVPEEPSGSPGLQKGSDVVFEAVADDVDIDPLPREDLFSERTPVVPPESQELSQVLLSQDETDFSEYSTDISASQSDEDKLKTSDSDLFSDAEQVVQAEKLVVLQSCVETLQKRVNDEGIQSFLQSVDTLRNREDCSFNEKIFLQLLSSIGTHLERCELTSQAAALELLKKVYSALELSTSSTISIEQVQQELVECTGQVLFLQQETVIRSDFKSVATPDVESSLSSEGQNAIMDMVQNEMTQMRKTFQDDINSLRKELTDRS